MPPMLPTEEERVAAAARTGSAAHDIFSPMPIDRHTGQQQQPSRASEHAEPDTQQVSAQEELGASGDPGSGDVGESDAAVSTKSGTMTKKELHAFAERRKLDYKRLLADAEAQGIMLADE